MANAKRLPSGNYRVLAYDYTDANGKRHYKSYTAPTKKEAELMALTSQKKPASELTLIEALDRYCDDKSNVLSPATIKGYKGYKQALLPIGHKNLVKIDYTLLQGYINDISKNKSAKTVKNIYSLIKAILKHNGYTLDKDVTLPKRQKTNYVLPSEDDIKTLLEYSKEKDIELYKAICLGAIGMMRRSEISALTADDITGNTIHICKAVVLDEHNNWILKNTKTYHSDRYVTMPQEIIDILPKDGDIVSINPASISDRFRRLVTKLGLNSFSFHDCRHFGATLMHTLGIPDQYIMLQGGWSSDGVLKAVYRNTLPEYQKNFENIAEKQFKKLL